MSTKTIAVEHSVYERLAREKRASESFTKTIERLIDSASSGTCALRWRTRHPSGKLSAMTPTPTGWSRWSN